jgi:hypothetical protein
MNPTQCTSSYQPRLGLPARRGLTRRTPQPLGLPPSGQGAGGCRLPALASSSQPQEFHLNKQSVATSAIKTIVH